MSAYICGKDHIVYIVQAALDSTIVPPRHGGMYWYNGQPNQLRCGDYDKAAEVANLLWRENIKSVSARYPNESSDTLPGPHDRNFIIEPGDFEAMPKPISKVQVFKALDCYEYQSCEHEGWETSEAHTFINALRAKLWSSLPGYESAQWGAPVMAESEAA